MTADQLIARLTEMGSEDNVAGMARYGIRPARALGVAMARLKSLAKDAGVDHTRALELWEAGIHESRLLAALTADPALTDGGLMERWAADFDSWALCDSTCGHLFRKASSAWSKAVEWCGRDELLVKRAGFALTASLAVHDKAAPDSAFDTPLELVRSQAADSRRLVHKAVDWALRSIGRRNERLNAVAIELAAGLVDSGDAFERRVGMKALRELTSEKVQRRFADRKGA